MKIKYYGTAAAEGIPGIFCDCILCQRVRETKGKDIRTRTQTMIDDHLMIDFSADAYMHSLYHGLDLLAVEAIIFSHSHSDHFYPEDLVMRLKGYAHGNEKALQLYGNKTVKEKFIKVIEDETMNYEDALVFNELKMFESYSILGYTVTPLKADHDKREECFIYQIEKDGKTMLYAHDTGKIFPELWEYWKEHQTYFDFVSMDCTHQAIAVPENHMGLPNNIDFKTKLIEEKIADKNTVFVISHFSHNGRLLHDEMVELVKDEFIVAYDGLEIEF